MERGLGGEVNPELRSHQEWMGFLQPVGLVVSPPALVAAQAFVNRNVAREQQRLASVVTRVRVPAPDGGSVETWALTDFPAFTREVLDWQAQDLLNAPGQPALPEALAVALPEYGDTLKPTYAVPDPDDASRYLLLVELLPLGTELDRDPPAEGRRWQASPEMRFERLLRETGVAVGMLCNGTHLRLVYRPPGESSGHVTFPIAAMMEPAGRPILGALVMLLGAERLFTLPPNQRLPHILRESRKYQNEVSTALAEQVLGALHELLRGFQAAHDAARGELLRDVLREARGEVYGGLLTVLLRMVFVLYAEDRGLLGGDPVYQSSYALTGLFAELREDAARHPDTMDQRFGAWARVLVLFRLVHDGASHGGLRMPPRYGRLFDPDVYPFLEGRPHRSLRQHGARVEVPRVSDGVVYRVLDALLMLSGERLSYRALDVEQIGSVYEAMMGFTLETAAGPSIAVKPQHVVLDLGALVAKGGAERVKALADEAGCKLPAAQAERVKAAKTVDALVAALDKRVSPRTPTVVPAGAMFLQPGEERRRSGSHYTPRSLTEPIVRTTLRPVLQNLTPQPPLHAWRGGAGRQGERVPVTGGAYVDPVKLARAREFRREPTPAEAEAWELLRGRRMLGLKFRRQQPFQGLILDFYCPARRLCLSIDGGIHDDPAVAEYDAVRSELLRAHGISEVRVRNENVSAEGLRKAIETSPPNPLSMHGEGEPERDGGDDEHAIDPGIKGLDRTTGTPVDAPSWGDAPSSPLSMHGEGGRGGGVPRPEALLALKVCDPAMGSGAFLVEACRALGDALVASWQRHGLPADLPEGEDPVLHARRLVAQRCLYGVDKNPFAVDLARLSLWLVTLAKDHPFTFLDHALRQGDSLVGLSREQIACLHWEVGKQLPMVRAVVDKAVREAEARRGEIHARAMGDDVREKRRLLDEAERAVADVRMLGDCVVAAFFDEEKDAARKKRVKALGDLVNLTPPAPLSLKGEGGVQSNGTTGEAFPPPSPFRERGAGGVRSELVGMAQGLRERARPVTPFHWEVEFPEVFSRENPGFDAIVGNPPFLGGMKISTAQGFEYTEWLIQSNRGTGNRADLCAYFYGRSFALLRANGTFGLIATNTISQGDTREAGLLQIRKHGGEIFAARRRLRWPGAAAVVVSVVHIVKGRRPGKATLDDETVPTISAYLWPNGGDESPHLITANGRIAHEGVKPMGGGFIVDPEDAARAATIAAIVEREPQSRGLVVDYMSGEDLNGTPTVSATRKVINFGEMTFEQARAHPDLLAVLERDVMPERARSARDQYRKYWWRLGERQPTMQNSIGGLRRYLAVSQVGSHCAFAFVPRSVLPSNLLTVFAFDVFLAFGVMQSRVHEVWARFFGSSMKDDLRYVPADCCGTFPFPAGVLEAARGDAAAQALPAVQRLEDIGQRYYEFRAKLMVDHNEGLTATYNRFHDPEERDASILRLRELHAEMDRAVLDAYGWQDVQPRCEFLLDYEEEGDEEEESGKRRKKKPWRYRWPDEVRDEVLARLIALNGERAAQERRVGEAMVKAEAKPARAVRKKKGDDGGQGGLFG